MGQFIVTGDNVAEQLEKLTPASLSTLAVNSQQYTVLTNNNGGVIDDIIVTRLADRYLIIVNAACKQKDYEHLKKHFSSDCQLSVLSEQALIAVQGPMAKDVMQTLNQEACQLKFMQAIETKINDMPCIVSRCGYTGEDGFEISIANNHAEKLAKQILAFEQVEAVGLGARDTLRLEAGLSLYGHDLDEANTPLDAGLQWLIQRTDGYLGAEYIREQLAAGSSLQRVGLSVEGKIPVREGEKLFNHHNEVVGLVTSGGYSPSLGQPIALAQVSSLNDDTEFYTQKRNHTIKLRKVNLPFVEHKYRR